ncbi:MAG: type II toxin-antitoxin system VapC family toxin [Bifidobacteriaceae bacterium]|jgi:predicted nucleic acid-binding protein|nr:type II toxin-antitoxin system VapC family toxin [Bifidobacteriaceae bacterium]
MTAAFLLDTNVVSELRKQGSGRAHPGVVAWSDTLDDSAAFISALTLFELEKGVLLAERRDKGQAEALREWLDGTVRRRFAARVLPVDYPVCARAAALHLPDPRPVVDSLIAGTALVHGLTLATRNSGDFDSIAGLKLVNPWLQEPK